MFNTILSIKGAIPSLKKSKIKSGAKQIFPKTRKHLFRGVPQVLPKSLKIYSQNT